MQKRAA
ncbi:hypothetical protein D043_2747B, partial [Vibrio parahaemolyticus EKP-021]